MRLRWMFTDQPPLDVPFHVINNRILNADHDSDTPVGQLLVDDQMRAGSVGGKLYGTWPPGVECNYAQDERWVLPPGFEHTHTCHKEWFTTGEPWPNSLPPTVYDDYAMPDCCGPINHAPTGGIEIGGAVVHNYGYRHAPAGGFVIGGHVVHNFGFTHAPIRGLVIGGAVVHSFGFAHTPAGGLDLGGAVTHSFGFTHAPAGGLDLGGAVVHSFGFHHDPTGGVEIGGAVVHSFGFHHDPTGGVEIGGAVVHSFGFSHTVLGGLDLGGLVPHVWSIIHAPAGGLDLGGAVVHSFGFTHEPTGGVEIGGAVTHTYTPPVPTPGHTCATAGALAVGQSYSGTIVAGSDDWFTFNVVSGTHYTVTLTAVGFAPVNTNAAHGSCASQVSDGAVSNSGSFGWTAGSSGQEWIHSTIFIGSKAYTVHLTSP